jgi:hypothetical protein
MDLFSANTPQAPSVVARLGQGTARQRRRSHIWFQVNLLPSIFETTFALIPRLLVLLSAAGAWGDAAGNLTDTLDLLTLLTRAFDLLAAVLGWQFLREEVVGVGGEVEVLEYETVGLCPGAAWSQMLVVSPLLFQTIHQAYLDGLKCVPKWSRTGFSMSATAKASATALAEGVARMLEPVRQCLYHLGTLYGEVFPPTHAPSSFAASLLALVEELLLNGESEDLPDAAQEEELVDGARYH